MISNKCKREAILTLPGNSIFDCRFINFLKGASGYADIESVCDAVDKIQSGDRIIQSKETVKPVFNTAKAMRHYQGQFLFGHQFCGFKIDNFQPVESGDGIVVLYGV